MSPDHIERAIPEADEIACQDESLGLWEAMILSMSHHFLITFESSYFLKGEEWTITSEEWLNEARRNRTYSSENEDGP